MTMSAGSLLGPYEILSPIGSGGMGEVYKARDTRLERTVAVKVLPQHLSASSEVRQRFEREARTISQLSHPHICALYDVGCEGETEYLVMEYLEGETLADRLAKGPLPIEQTLRYGIQIADALEKAHRHGVVHRDLKPGNVMLTRAGVKLLDFGLARVIQPKQASPLSALPTEEKPVTAEGTILGTLQYMAPEQLEGKPTDARTDIFAFGAVLYEMATGRKAFSGISRASVIGEILHTDPPVISTIQRISPPALDRIVKTCLAKDPDDRWQSAGDVGKELQWIAEGGASEPRGGPGPRSGRVRREWIAWAVAALALALAAAATLLPRRSVSLEDPMRFRILPPPGYLFLPVVEMSSDARRLLCLLQDESGRNSVWVRSLDSLEMRRLAGTEDARGMFWSPDGREIGLFSDGKLKRMSADGGPLRTVCGSGGAFIGSWSPDGTIVFEENFGEPLVGVSASGGTPRPVT
ncbi:MAG TPA: protein kinase, partial [Thermoanaerobaculia bacterium]|nr:protein kinase [Thermoanaerobaculia bacterium]